MDERIKDLQLATTVALNHLIAIDGEGLAESKRISLDQLKMILGIIAASGIEGVVPSQSFIPPPPPGGSTVVYFAKPGTYPGFTGMGPLTEPLNLISWNGSSAQGLGIDIGVDLSDYPNKNEAVLKDNFGESISSELAGKAVIRTFGLTEPFSDLNVQLINHYYWSAPIAISRVTGTIDRVRTRLLTAGQVIFVVGTALPDSGGFTVLRTLGTFNGAAGLNTFNLSTGNTINAGEIVVISGNRTATMNLATGEHSRDSKWVQQTASGLVGTDFGYWLYDYSASGAWQSDLYNVFPTKTDVADTYVSKDGLVDYPKKEEAVLKENFHDSVRTELDGTAATKTIGIGAAGGFTTVFNSAYYWTYPQGICPITGTVDLVSVRLQTPGPVTVVIGSAQYNSGGFTVRKTVGTFNGVAGLNEFAVSEAITEGEIVAIQGNGTSDIQLGVQNIYGSRWIRQNAGGFLDSSTGWMPYSYRVTGVRKSVLYDVFTTKDEVGEEYVSKMGFGDALTENVEGTEVSLELGKLSGSLTAPLGSNRYHWTYPDCIATLDGDITEVSVRLSTAGRVFFAIGTAQYDKGGFSARKLIGPFDAATGLSSFLLVATEHIKTGEILALAMPTGETTDAVVNFASGTGSRWIHQTAAGFIGSAAGWWTVGYKMTGIEPSVLDSRYVSGG